MEGMNSMKRLACLVLVGVILIAAFMPVASASKTHGVYRDFYSKTCFHCSEVGMMTSGCIHTQTVRNSDMENPCSIDGSCMYGYRYMQMCCQFHHANGNVLHSDNEDFSVRHMEIHIMGQHDNVVCPLK